MNVITVMQAPDGEKISLALSRFADEISNFTEFFKKWLEPLLLDIFKEIFDTEGASGADGSWAPLSAKYEAWKSRNYPGRTILVREGDLKNLMTDSAEFVSQAFPQEYTVWTSKIGMYHQKGTPKMPARPIFSLTEKDIKAIGKNLHAFAYEAWRNANKDIFRSETIAEYDTSQAEKRWGA